jgi:hypothetical protein
MRKDKYLFIPKKSGLFSATDWIIFFKKYVNSKKEDLPILWRTISLKVMDLLLKQNCIKIPYIGVLEVVVKKPTKDVTIVNDKPYWRFPRSEFVFTADLELRKIFDKKFFALYEIKQLEDGTFDWIKKSNDTRRYERR